MKQFILLALLAFSINGQSKKLPTITTTDLYTCTRQAILDFQALISTGVYLTPPGFLELLDTPLLTFPDKTVINAGIVALPFPFLCNQTGLILRVLCRLASADCTYVHNKYGGKCGVAANPVEGTPQTLGPVFICNDQKPTGYNFADISDKHNCGPLLGPLLDPLLDLAIGEALRTRLQLDLCFPISGTDQLNSVGCNIDCRYNHQYSSGTCVTNATPTAVFPGELGPELQYLRVEFGSMDYKASLKI